MQFPKQAEDKTNEEGRYENGKQQVLIKGDKFKWIESGLQKIVNRKYLYT